jgi:hypothetical protein
LGFGGIELLKLVNVEFSETVKIRGEEFHNCNLTDCFGLLKPAAMMREQSTVVAGFISFRDLLAASYECGFQI